MTGYFPRDIGEKVLEALNEMPVVVIAGMRQTGKSTFLQRQKGIGQRRYVSFDDFAHLEAALRDPDGFVSSDLPLTIDEAQKCPAILTAIKKRVDRKRIPGQFLLSGSADFTLLKGISESLAGRSVYFTMTPFTRREIFRKISQRPFLQGFFEARRLTAIKTSAPVSMEEILQGGMPTVCLGEVKNRELWFKGYEQTYLERDVRELSQIGNIIGFRHLMHLIALRTGQLLSPSQLGRDAKLNTTTTSRYMSLLETSFIISRLSPYLKSRASRLIKSPKLYLSDSGLACHLGGIKNLEDEPLMGAMFETYVAQNIAGILYSRWPEANIFYWSIQGRHEVDFIIEAGRKCLAIEVKASSRWNDRDLSGLKAFLSSTPNCIAAILAYNGSEAVRLGERIFAIPLDALLV